MMSSALQFNHQQITTRKEERFQNLLHKENIFDPLYNHHSTINNNVKKELSYLKRPSPGDNAQCQVENLILLKYFVLLYNCY